ncbi:MAG: asparagine synthetase B [Acidobacteria bacterium]|nr:MAG: asparagine synthetase B [Acidobacteriota bacterium]
MAGIFGVVHFDARPIERDLVARMSAALCHRGPDGDSIACDGSVALGCRLPRVTRDAMFETQPVRRLSGTWLVFDGRLDNRDDLIAELREHSDVSAGTPDAEIVAACYETLGDEFARHLLGDFSVAIFDRLARRVVLARDAIGIRPLYYRRTATSVRFASDIKGLLADPEIAARPNDRLLAELLLGRLHRRDDDGSTLFAGVQGLPAAHVGIFSGTGSTIHRYWDFDGRPAPAGSADDYAEGFRHVFRQAVERRLRSRHPVAIAVSGGLDSSSIFCLASRVAGGTPLVGLTYSTRDGQTTDESAFLAEVERASGRSIEYLNPPRAGLLFQSDELVDCTESPMLDAQWFRGQQLLTSARTAGARTLLTGDWGDHVLFDQAYLVDLLHAGSWLTVRAHLEEYRRWYSDATNEFSRRFVGDVMEYDLPYWVRRAMRAVRSRWNQPAPWDDWYSQRFRREVGPDVFDHDLSHLTATRAAPGATVLARALYREVRSRYHGLCLEWNNKTGARYGVDCAFPFLDRDLIEFVMGVPGASLAQDGVPKALLRRALSGMVPDAVLQRRTKGDFTADVNEASRRDYPAIMKMLGPDALVAQFGYVDTEKLTRGLTALEGALEGSASCVASWRLAELVALELWLRRFVGTREREQNKDNAWLNSRRLITH